MENNFFFQIRFYICFYIYINVSQYDDAFINFYWPYIHDLNRALFIAMLLPFDMDIVLKLSMR